MLNTSNAINYNANRKFSTKAIGIIQSVVNAPTKGLWDTLSVTQVHKFQSARSQLGSPDGKVGPKTLGAVIGELQSVKRIGDAAVLKQWSYTMPSAPTQPGAINPVSAFWQATTMPYRFERFRGIDPTTHRMEDRWRAACVFKVHVGLNPNLTQEQACRYEYRQFIRGNIWVKVDGKDWVFANGALKVPAYGGCQAAIGLPRDSVTGDSLNEHQWKEDGEVRSPKDRYYGHRISALVRDSRCQDEWLPHGVGHDYYLSDQPSITGTWPKVPIEVWMELYFQGYVVEVEEDDQGFTRPIRVVQQKNWVCHSQTMRLSNYFSAIAV
jgi:peptidoglycan hydrolase-like protein with peptidoglycan-binding domain